MSDISKIIFTLMEKKFSGIINIGSGKKTYLKDIANIILKKYKKKADFIDISETTYLLSDNSKLKKISGQMATAQNQCRDYYKSLFLLHLRKM